MSDGHERDDWDGDRCRECGHPAYWEHEPERDLILGDLTGWCRCSLGCGGCGRILEESRELLG